MVRLPPRSTRTDPLVPHTTLFRSAAAIAQRVSGDPNVAYAEPDRIMRPMLEPNDARYGEQWHYFETTGGSSLPTARSEEQTSELPSLMRISYAVLCFK